MIKRYFENSCKTPGGGGAGLNSPRRDNKRVKKIEQGIGERVSGMVLPPHLKGWEGRRARGGKIFSVLVLFENASQIA